MPYYAICDQSGAALPLADQAVLSYRVINSGDPLNANEQQWPATGQSAGIMPANAVWSLAQLQPVTNATDVTAEQAAAAQVASLPGIVAIGILKTVLAVYAAATTKPLTAAEAAAIEAVLTQLESAHPGA